MKSINQLIRYVHDIFGKCSISLAFFGKPSISFIFLCFFESIELIQ